jgi:hypothetical protein
MSRLFLAVPMAAVAVLAVFAVPAMAAPRGGGPPPGLVQGHVVDYVKPPGTPGGGGGGGSTPTAMATDFKLAKQHWLTSPVEYTVDGTNCGSSSSSCKSSVDAGFDAWQPTSGVTFTDNGSTSQTNPCTGQPNSVSWTTLDGAGNVLAQTLPCYYLGTNQMAGFVIQFDQADPWSTCSSSCPSNAFSIQAVATHESGHAVGLNHVGAPRDIRLTMYPAIGLGDFGIATLGCGDQLGTARQYGTSFTCTAGGTVPLD